MRLSHSNRRRRGTLAIIVAVCITVILSMVAISVDGGVLQDKKRHVQSTSDAAALAGASVIYEEFPKHNGKDTNGKAKQAAMDIAAAHGYKNSEVTVNIPPKSGPYTGMDTYIEVIIDYPQQRFFSKIFGGADIPVRARAVARGAWVPAKFGVLVLDYTGKATLTTQGNGAFTETGAPVLVNSNNSAAVVDGGNGVLIAQEFDITGNYTNSGNGAMITQPTPNNIFTGVHPTPDPLAYLPEPTAPPAGVITELPLGGGNKQYTLSPGTYYNLPNFNTGDVVLFQGASAGNGGIFYLATGGLTSTGATLKMDPLTSGGMMIYNAGTGTSDKINITGNPAGTVNLTPLTSGIYKGITFFQNRSGTQEVHVEGNGAFTIKGTLYVAGAELQVAGNGAVSNIGSQYVSKELAISGNGNVFISYAGDEVAPTRIITLVE